MLLRVCLHRDWLPMHGMARVDDVVVLYCCTPWGAQVIIIVEGIYSMEGETTLLKELVELKKKYRWACLNSQRLAGPPIYWASARNGRGTCRTPAESLWPWQVLSFAATDSSTPACCQGIYHRQL